MQVRVSGGPLSKVMPFREIADLLHMVPARRSEVAAMLNKGKVQKVYIPGTEMDLELQKVG